MMQSKTVLTELETVKSPDTPKPWTMEEFEDLLKQRYELPYLPSISRDDGRRCL